MAKRLSTMVRNGRFSGIKATASDVVKGTAGRSYRFFNTGKDEIQITTGGGTASLEPRNAIDLETGGDVSVECSSGVGEGLYEMLSRQSELRTGKVQVPSGGDITIIQGRVNSLYRLFNSGKTSLKLSIGTADYEVLPRLTLDFTTTGDVAVGKAASGALSGYPVRAFFDDLDVRSDTRSGRFNIRKTEDAAGKTVIDPTDRRPIIIATGVAGSAWYRLLNSGEYPIRVLQGAKVATATKLIDLDADQSVDFEVTSAAPVVVVKSTDEDKPIRGIYDFIGRT